MRALGGCTWTEGVAEKIENITTKYGYWSTTELWKFDNVTGNSTRVPFDAHELVSLVAPVRSSFGYNILTSLRVIVPNHSGLSYGTKVRKIGG